MKLCVKETRKLKGKIRAPGSKSHTHRALVLALLSEGARILDPLKSEDTLCTKNAIESLGAQVKEENGSWLVEGTAGRIMPQKEIIDVGNSGTSMRFLTSIASFSREWITLTGDESIKKRPMGPLIKALEPYAHIQHEGGKPPLKIKKKPNLSKRNIQIPGNVSSQFVSSLLLSAPLTGMDLKVTTDLKSKPYVGITTDMMEKIGLEVSQEKSSYHVKEQRYPDFTYQVPGDYSSVANIMAPCTFLDSDVKIENLDPEDPQGDKRFVSILKKMGCPIEREGHTISIKNPSELKPVDISASDIPDLVLPLVSVCLFAEGRSFIRGISHLKHKESNRLNAALEFRKLGGKVDIQEDALIIKGPCDIKAGILNGFKDHRVVMALASAAMKAKGETRIDSADKLSISYPTYIEDMKSLGANITLEENGS